MFAGSADMSKKKCAVSKSSKTPSIEAVSRRADELGMTYGRYVQSPQYIIDTALILRTMDTSQKGRRKASDSRNI